MSAAVVLVAHGVGEGLAPCRRELAADDVLIVGVPIAVRPFELTAGFCWPVLTVLPAPAAPLSAPVAAVVSAGSGLVLVAVGVGEGEVDAGVGDGDGELDEGFGELLVDEVGGPDKRPFGLGLCLHPGGLAELRGWLEEGPGDPKPVSPPLPPPGPGLSPPGLTAREFVEVPAGKRVDPCSPT